ncbi:MAG: HAMP domain-containing sensor histidine kinase [Planctomycetota bacterium]|nr:HAMP domain-containing sensor histidine kinase [Planctomycetota bacterium]MDA0917915.1 HAMP domain-containing sensor histidine kinase [Planctomycetota bacterium]MDA1159211.1 HAMP domain-containing sensor histidine kinase [Planctomycetota bacterium]
MRRPIRIQILLPFSATMVAAVAIIAMTSAWMDVRREEEQTLLRIQNVVDTLSDSRLTYTEAILEKMSGLSGAEFLALDRDDRPVAATLPDPELIAKAAKAAPVISSKSSMTQLPRVDTEIGTCFAARVTADRAGPVRTLLVLYPEASWKEARWTAIWPPLVVGSGTVVVMACISAWLADRISRRINGVRTLLEEIADGSFSHEHRDRRSGQGNEESERVDEIDDLIASAGSLSAQLRELQHTIQHTERVRLLAQLAGGLAHQLRNAVTGARMAVQLHQQRCPLNSKNASSSAASKSDDTLNVALHQLTLTEEQIRGLLSLSRQEVDPVQATSLSEAVREVERLIAVQCEHFRVSLLVQLPENVDWSIADAAGFRTAVLNLSLNAIEAAGEGGRVELEVLSDGEATGDVLRSVSDTDGRARQSAVVVEVRDSGAGPPSEIAEYLFEPFVTSKPEGVGLGLALAKNAAEAASGSLWWERRDGLTVFRFSVPAQPVAAELAHSCREVS